MDAAQGLCGQHTAADHIGLVDRRSRRCRRRTGNLIVTVDGAGFSHKLLEHLDTLASRRAHADFSCGWELDQRRSRHPAGPRARVAIAIDHRGRSASAAPMMPAAPGMRSPACWIEEAHVTELTGCCAKARRDQLEGWPEPMRIFAPASGRIPAQAQLVRARGRLPVPAVGHQPARDHQGWRGQNAYIDTGHRCTPGQTASAPARHRIGRFPSHATPLTRPG